MDGFSQGDAFSQILGDGNRAAHFRRAAEARRAAITALMLDDGGAHCWRDLLLGEAPGRDPLSTPNLCQLACPRLPSSPALHCAPAFSRLGLTRISQ